MIVGENGEALFCCNDNQAEDEDDDLLYQEDTTEDEEELGSQSDDIVSGNKIVNRAVKLGGFIWLRSSSLVLFSFGS